MPPIQPPLVAGSSDRWSTTVPACAVAVGNFDGVHRGHAAIVARLCAAARRLGIPSVVLSFDPHPATILRPATAPVPLTTARRRANLLEALGVDAVLVQPADRDLMALSAERFFTDVLRGRLGARAVVEGADFRFGAGRSGDVELLGRLCAADAVEFETVSPVVVDGLPVSSSRVRGLVAAGAVRDAADLLTAPYRLSGRVATGARRGAALGFPTANLADVATLLPGVGVYAGRAVLPDGAIHPAAIHVGPNVSFGETRVTVEAHLIGFSGSLYGAALDVDFLDRLRDTVRFDSIDALRTQLAADAARAFEVAGAAPPPRG